MSRQMSPQAAYEAATLEVERELDMLYQQTVGDLIRATPDGWRQRLDDVLNEIAEALVYRRRTML